MAETLRRLAIGSARRRDSLSTLQINPLFDPLVDGKHAKRKPASTM